MADLLYSGSLLMALAAGVAGAALGGYELVRSSGAGAGRLRAATGSVVLAGLSLLVSVVVHRRWGHGPASVEPMDAARFVDAHPAFLVATAVLVVGIGVNLYASRRRRRGRAAI